MRLVAVRTRRGRKILYNLTKTEHPARQDSLSIVELIHGLSRDYHCTNYASTSFSFPLLDGDASEELFNAALASCQAGMTGLPTIGNGDDGVDRKSVV